jgi:hypothetical protein
MIDWVMPPQTAVTLYIYRLGRSCPARNPFTTRNSQGLLNSTQTQGPPVRPVRPTGETGVAVARSATRRPTGQTVKGHRSDQWRQPDRPCAKFGCEQDRWPPLAPVGGRCCSHQSVPAVGEGEQRGSVVRSGGRKPQRQLLRSKLAPAPHL